MCISGAYLEDILSIHTKATQSIVTFVGASKHIHVKLSNISCLQQWSCLCLLPSSTSIQMRTATQANNPTLELPCLYTCCCSTTFLPVYIKVASAIRVSVHPPFCLQATCLTPTSRLSCLLAPTVTWHWIWPCQKRAKAGQQRQPLQPASREAQL